jgi:hypothetical protein
VSTKSLESTIYQFSPEPVLCWCNGQSLESRYSQVRGAGAGAGAAGAIGAGIARTISQRQLGKARLPDAELLPAHPVVAVSASHVMLFDARAATAGPFATFRRDQVRVACRGNPMWRRLDLTVTGDGGTRSYTVMVSFAKSQKRLRMVVDELGRATA